MVVKIIKYNINPIMVLAAMCGALISTKLIFISDIIRQVHN